MIFGVVKGVGMIVLNMVIMYVVVFIDVKIFFVNFELFWCDVVN